MMRDWANLNEGLLDMILDRLSLIDRPTIGLVCRLWRSTLHSYVSLYRSLIPSYPLVMSPDFTCSRNRVFLDPCDGRHITLSLSELCAHKCIGSSGSWLIVHSFISPLYDGCRIFLYNPFTTERIMLPDFFRLEGKFIILDQVVACSEPARASYFSIICFSSYVAVTYLHYLHSGNEHAWSSLKLEAIGSNIYIIQAVFLHDRVFYALTNNGLLWYINLDKNQKFVCKHEAGRIHFNGRQEKAHMVVYSTTRLVVVITSRISMKIIRAHQLYLPLLSTGWLDAEVNSLMKDRLMFLGPNGSLIVPYVATAIAKSTTQVHTMGVNSPSGFFVLPQPICEDRKYTWWAWPHGIMEVCIEVWSELATEILHALWLVTILIFWLAGLPDMQRPIVNFLVLFFVSLAMHC